MYTAGAAVCQPCYSEYMGLKMTLAEQMKLKQGISLQISGGTDHLAAISC